MKSKILIPVMAFVFAIGMSFTTEKPTANVWAYDGINNPKPVFAIGCDQDEEEQCSGEIAGDAAEYLLFHDEALQTPVMGGGTTATLIE